MKNPILTIHMQRGGTIEIELYPHCAPNSVNSVIHLAKRGLYDGRCFYRVVRDFVLQTDCAKRDWDKDGCDYLIDGEYANSGFMNPQPTYEKGVVGMAGTGGSSNVSSGSTFFIMTGPMYRLDGDFAVIGRVVSGIEEVDRLNEVECNAYYYRNIPFYTPKLPEVMEKVRVETFGVDYPAPITKPYTEDYSKREKELDEIIAKSCQNYSKES